MQEAETATLCVYRPREGIRQGAKRGTVVLYAGSADTKLRWAASGVGAEPISFYHSYGQTDDGPQEVCTVVDVCGHCTMQ